MLTKIDNTIKYGKQHGGFGIQILYPGLIRPEAELEKDIAKLVSFGTLFLANPDLPNRFELDAELNQPDRATMFGGGAQGYIDYPSLNN